jgi:perosamine synthetase
MGRGNYEGAVIPFGRPIIGSEEKDAVSKVLEGPILVHGPLSKSFETQFSSITGADEACSVSSCTAALHLAFFDSQLGAGDEVLVPSLTHVATVHAASLTGASPVFIDCDPVTGNMDLEKMECAITRRTKAIAIVHFLGVPVDMRKVMDIAAKKELLVIEDCALAMGSIIDGTHVGLFGDYGCFSFYPVKHITTGEGGMLISKDKARVDRVKQLRAFCVDRTHAERNSLPGWYDVSGVGFNYRMSEISAAIGIEQLRKLPGFLTQRKTNFMSLKDRLSELESVRILGAGDKVLQSSFYCMNIIFEDNDRKQRDLIIKNLHDRGIGTSIYYPQPVPCFAAYSSGSISIDSYENAQLLCDKSISFPVGPHLNEQDMIRVAEGILEAKNTIFD